MSDIGIFSDPLSIVLLYAIFGAPGLVLGVILGAIIWRKHRIWGALLGAIIGFWMCIGAVWVWVVN